MDILYNNFKGGYNDTLSPLNIGNNELLKAENVDIISVVKGFQTRKGNSIHAGPFTNALTHTGEFMAGGELIKYVVSNNILYKLDGGSLVERKTGLNASRIYEFYFNNRLYFTDGVKYMVWGDYDYTSESGTVDISDEEIVLNLGSTGGGIEDHFYQAKGTFTGKVLGTEDYSDILYWEDVTEVAGKNSSVVRNVEDYNGKVHEVSTLEIFDGCEESGTLSIFLDDIEFTVDVVAGDDVDTIVDKIIATSFSGWTVTRDGNTVIFTADVAELKSNGYFDPKDTCVYSYMVTETNGQPDDNDLTPINKCTMFLVHPTSMRVFAAGNPDDPDRLYYSDIGNPTYFSSINRLVPIQGEGSILAMINIHDAVLLSFKTQWYKWRGIEVGEDAEWKAISLPNEAVNNDCVALTPYSFMYLSDDGLFKVSASIIGEDTTMVSTKSVIKNTAKDKVMKTIASIKNATDVEGIFHNNKYLLAYSDLESGINNKVLEYSLDNDGFTVISGWRVDKWLKSKDGELYFISDKYVLKAYQGYHDIDILTGNSTAINFDVQLRYVDMGTPLIDKLMRFLKIIANKQDHAVSSINLDIIAGDSKKTITDIDLSKGLVATDNMNIERIINVTMVSDYFKIRLYNSTVDDKVSIAGLGMNYEKTRAKTPNSVSVSDLLV
jgi:hypothetical protein